MLDILSTTFRLVPNCKHVFTSPVENSADLDLVSFNNMFLLPSTSWLCCCMRNKLCHLMVTFVMLKWYELLYYNKNPAIYWMTLVSSSFYYMYTLKWLSSGVGGLNIA